MQCSGTALVSSAEHRGFDSRHGKEILRIAHHRVAAVGKLFTLICLGGGRAVFTKGGCLVAPTVNPECTALHVRHLRIRIIVYSLSYVVKPVRFDIGCIKRNIFF